MSELKEWHLMLKDEIANPSETLGSGGVLNFLRSVALAYDIPVATARSAYYRFKKEEDEPMQAVGLQVGTMVEVRVKSIASYGVIVETVDASRTGLIHISSVKDEYIEDLTRYFKLGDVIRAELIALEEDRMNFSTFKTALPDYWENKRVSKVSIEPKQEPNQELYTYIGEFANVGLNAKCKLDALVNEFGAVKVALNLGKVKVEDYAVWIVEQVEKQIRGYL
jgi:predicted RNA-binding protein with RPS1 domain